MGIPDDIVEGLTTLGGEIPAFGIGQVQGGNKLKDIFQNPINRAALHRTGFF